MKWDMRDKARVHIVGRFLLAEVNLYAADDKRGHEMNVHFSEWPSNVLEVSPRSKTREGGFK